MKFRRLGALLLLSLVGATPAPLRGQLIDLAAFERWGRGSDGIVETPNGFQAFAQGQDIVIRWSGTSDADAYAGEVDQDPAFESPSRWVVEDDRRRTLYERRFRAVGSGTYYVRIRAVERFWIISRQSPWTHVERVSVGPAVPAWPGHRGGVPGGSQDLRYRGWDAPRWLEARAFGDELRIWWSAVGTADAYMLEVDRLPDFRSPSAFTVDAWNGQSVQQFTLRDVPAGRFYLRVRAADRLVSRTAFGWSEVEVIDVRGGEPVVRDRAADFRQGKRVDLDDRSREHPVFDRHPGRGKGHLKHHGKPDVPGHERDRDD